MNLNLSGVEIIKYKVNKSLSSLFRGKGLSPLNRGGSKILGLNTGQEDTGFSTVSAMKPCEKKRRGIFLYLNFRASQVYNI